VQTNRATSVVGEIAILPLAFGDWEIAIIWSILNASLLRYRIGIETNALLLRPFSGPRLAARTTDARAA
jgi:isoprenylcysteine carboxyl methyltransferase (ICMT) family protein YpbQ